MAAQTLYLVNVVGNMFFTDCFLGWEFYTYGVQAASFLEEDVIYLNLMKSQLSWVSGVMKALEMSWHLTFPKHVCKDTAEYEIFLFLRLDMI